MYYGVRGIEDAFSVPSDIGIDSTVTSEIETPDDALDPSIFQSGIQPDFSYPGFVPGSFVQPLATPTAPNTPTSPSSNSTLWVLGGIGGLLLLVVLLKR